MKNKKTGGFINWSWEKSCFFSLYMFTAFILVLSFQPLTFSATPVNHGTVRIYNNVNQTVIIYSRSWSYSGTEDWKEVHRIPPKKMATLPNIPEGAELGAKTQGDGHAWSSIIVKFSHYPDPMEILLDETLPYPQIRRP